MSNLIFPKLQGLSWKYSKTVLRSNQIQVGTSGIETRIQYWNQPKYKITLNYEFLTDNSFKPVGSVVAGDLETIMGFYNLVGGTYQDFLYQDIADYTASKQVFAIGDGVTNSFQLAKVQGGYGEPVYGVSDRTVETPAIYINDSLASKICIGSVVSTGEDWLTISNNLTEGTIVQFQDGTIPVTYIGLTANQNYYVKNVSNTKFKVSTTLNGTEVVLAIHAGNVNCFLTPASGIPLVSSVTGMGVVTFASPPALQSEISWSGKYYYRCRFLDDSLEFKGMMKALWSGDSINLQTLIPRGSTGLSI